MLALLARIGILAFATSACLPIVMHWRYQYRNRNNPFLKYRFPPIPGSPEEARRDQECAQWMATRDRDGRLRK